MESILLVILLLIALALIGVILLQQGKGAGMGASFGAGASGTVFGAPGSANILTKITTGLAIVFFITALALAVLSSQKKGEVNELLQTDETTEDGKAAVLETLSQGLKEQEGDLPANTVIDKKSTGDLPENVTSKVEEKVEEKKVDIKEKAEEVKAKVEEKQSEVENAIKAESTDKQSGDEKK